MLNRARIAGSLRSGEGPNGSARQILFGFGSTNSVVAVIYRAYSVAIELDPDVYDPVPTFPRVNIASGL